MNWIKKLFSKKEEKQCAIHNVMPSLSSLTDEHFYMFLEEGKIYLQHDFNGAEYFKDIKWFWNKDTDFLKRGEPDKMKAANKTYKNVEDWVFYCGGRNSGLWHPNWA